MPSLMSHLPQRCVFASLKGPVLLTSCAAAARAHDRDDKNKGCAHVKQTNASLELGSESRNFAVAVDLSFILRTSSPH